MDEPSILHIKTLFHSSVSNALLASKDYRARTEVSATARFAFSEVKESIFADLPPHAHNFFAMRDSPLCLSDPERVFKRPYTRDLTLQKILYQACKMLLSYSNRSHDFEMTV